MAVVFVLAAQAHPRVAMNVIGWLCWLYAMPAIFAPIVVILMLGIKPEGTEIPEFRNGQAIAGVSTMAILTLFSSVVYAVAALVANGALLDLVTTRSETQAAKSGWTPLRRRMLYVAFFCKIFINIIQNLGKDHLFRKLLPALGKNLSGWLRERDLVYYYICGIAAYTILPHRAYLQQHSCISRWLIWPSWASVCLMQYENEELKPIEKVRKSTSTRSQRKASIGNFTRIPVFALTIYITILCVGVSWLLPIELIYLIFSRHDDGILATCHGQYADRVEEQYVGMSEKCTQNRCCGSRFTVEGVRSP